MQEAHQRRLLMKAACHLGTCAHIFVGIQKAAHCLGLNVCVPQIHMLKSLLWSECLCPPNSHVEILTHKGMVLRGGTFGSCGHEDRASGMGLVPL